MRVIGLLGGMSWESTVSYYQLINREVNRRLGGLHSAKIILNSVDFAEVERLQHAGDWEGATALMCNAALQIERGGAECLVICTNTMHRMANAVAASISIPLLHIADATGIAVKKAGVQSVGLLGTRFTMEQDFYRGRLKEQHLLNVRTPDEADREVVHRVIYHELCAGKVLDASRQHFLQIVNRLVEQGAEAVILGCTEIGLLLTQSDIPVRLFDTTAIHALAAVDWSLAQNA